MPAPSVLQRLKERKLVQWALAYLAGAFVVFQLVDALDEPLGLTATIQRTILVAVLIGFFITLILAWYHGEKGRQRVSGPELLMVAALLVVAGAALTLVRAREGRLSPVALERDERPAIAVFPCENWSPDPGDAYFANGIHLEILLRLSKVNGLRSIGRESMEWYRENPLPMRQVAQELGVGFLGECGVLKDIQRNQVRVTFQLLDGNNGTQIWADTYDEDLSARNIFDIHTDVAQRVAQAVGAALTGEEQARIEAVPTTSLDAYELYLLGRSRSSSRSAETLREAIDLYEEAVRLDSTFALAFSGLADAFMVLPYYDVTLEQKDVYEEAKAAAARAYELDPAVGEIQASLGFISHVYEKDWEAAERYLSSAVELAPGSPNAHMWFSDFLHTAGRHEEALAEAEKALSLDPRSNVAIWVLAGRLVYAGRTDEAREWYEQALAMERPILWAINDFARNLGLDEPTDPTRAGELLAEFATLLGYPFPDRLATVAEAMTGGIEARTGAVVVLDDLVESTQLQRMHLLFLYEACAPAEVYLDVLEEAEGRNIATVHVPVSISRYRPDIREDPRFEHFLTQIRYPGSLE